ncbi:MAG: shikimate dehydrogenase [Myxococcota bacterium]
MPKIDGKTRVYGIMGCPVRHTLSPRMYNLLFESMGINSVYVPFEVEPESLPRALVGLRALGLQGVHLTAPFKEAVVPYLDRLSREAAAIGAVNVVLNTRGMLYGDNTDGRGYVRALQRELGYEVGGRTVALLGAGGSARAIAFTLARVGVATLSIFNRTLERAQKLAADLKHHYPALQVESLPLEAKVFSERAAELSLVIDCTTPAQDNPVNHFPVEGLSVETVVSDISYHHAGAPLLERAREAGLRTQDGLGMLVHQGALSLTLLAGLTVKPEQLEGYVKAR